MRALVPLCLLSVALAGDRIDEIKWMSSKDAFAKAKKSKKWVLVYKEWPR